MVAKSGWPVIGHRQVNSGHSIAISYGRAGFGFGKVSRFLEGWLGMALLLLSPVTGWVLSAFQLRRLKKRLACERRTRASARNAEGGSRARRLLFHGESFRHAPARRGTV